VAGTHLRTYTAYPGIAVISRHSSLFLSVSRKICGKPGHLLVGSISLEFQIPACFETLEFPLLVGPTFSVNRMSLPVSFFSLRVHQTGTLLSLHSWILFPLPSCCSSNSLGDPLSTARLDGARQVEGVSFGSYVTCVRLKAIQTGSFLLIFKTSNDDAEDEMRKQITDMIRHVPKLSRNGREDKE
jgi:hypothetical protein